MAQYPNSTAGGGIWTLEKQRIFQMGGNFPGLYAYDSIATSYVATGTATTITFSNIPSTYRHLQVRYSSRSSGGAYNPTVQFNSDTTAGNYRWHYITGNGATPSAGDGGASQISMFLGAVTATANTFTCGIIDILDYSSANKNKTIKTICGTDLSGSGDATLITGVWFSNSIVSTLTLNTSSAQYSHYALYGIAG